MRRMTMSVFVSVVLAGITGFAAQLPFPAGAQDRGVLAIDEEAGRYAFSFDSEADALNMCGTVGCEVVATFSACLAVAYSQVMIQQEQSVWTWIEADTEGTAGREALDDCERNGGAACEVLNVYCVAASSAASAAAVRELVHGFRFCRQSAASRLPV